MSGSANSRPAGSPALMSRVIELSRESMNSLNGGPFAALVVRREEIISSGTNSVTLWNDPTAHAEIVAIRRACSALKTFQLSDCEIYSSCEPCPMCLGAIYWARLRAVYYGGTASDAAAAGFDDAFIYKQMALPVQDRSVPFRQIMRDQAMTAFREWGLKAGRVDY